MYIGKHVTPHEIPKRRRLKKADIIGKTFNAARKNIRNGRTLKLAQYVKIDNKIYHYTDIIYGKYIKCFCENNYKHRFQLETEEYTKKIHDLYSFTENDNTNFSFSHGLCIIYENHSSSKQSFLTDAEWNKIEPQIKAVYNPNKLSLKDVIETIIYIEVKNVSRGQWPNNFLNYNTIHRKRSDLKKSEIWSLIQSIIDEKKNTLPPT